MSYQLNPQTAQQFSPQTTSFEVRPGRAVHTVKPGENLDTIARMYGTSSSTLIRLNNHQLGSNGHNIHAGMRLEI